MINAKAILAERLAKGEITEEEFDRLSSKIAGEANASDSIAAATAQLSVGVVPPTKKASRFFTILTVVGLSFLAYMLIVFPVNSKRQDIADARSKCDSRRFNCQCLAQNLENSLSIIYYVPVVRQFARPATSEMEARITGYMMACRR